MELISLIVGIVFLIVFLSMVDNISKIRNGIRRTIEQNEEIIRLLGGGKPEDRPKEAKYVTPKEMLQQQKQRASQNL